MGVWVAGPSAAGVMADWGADVIKVEPPVGDPFRGLFGTLGYDSGLPNPPFALDNRGKRCVVLDLQRPGGPEVMQRILATADVFVTNLRPDALERLSLSPDELAKRHPRLIYASVTGYGLSGPDRNRPSYDVGAFWARTGIARQLVPPDTPPPGIRGGLGDHATGLATVAGVLAALLERERTGRGRLVETSLLRTGMYCLGWDLGIQLMLGKVAPASPREDNPAPLVNCYRSGDDRWFFLLGLEADRHFPGLLRAIGRPELASDPRFSTAAARRSSRAELIAILDQEFAKADLDEWAKRFEADDVWWAPAQTPAEAVEDPQAHAVGAFVDVEGTGEGPGFKAIASPVHFHGIPQGHAGPVPGLGEHTESFLAELGLSPSELDRLRQEGAIPS